MLTRLLLVLALILALAGGGYWFWTQTPQYSMRELAVAVKSHDSNAFHAYVDVDSVANNAVEDLMSDSVREAGGADLLRRFLGAAIIGIFKPDITQMLKNSIESYVTPQPPKAPSLQVETQSQEPKSLKQELKATFGRFLHKIGEAIKPPSLKEVLQQIGISKENYRGLTSFETSDNICHVGLKFQRPDQFELIVQLELQKVENHWQVKRISNLPELAKSLSGF